VSNETDDKMIFKFSCNLTIAEMPATLIFLQAAEFVDLVIFN